MIVDRYLKNYIWRHDVNKETFTLIEKSSGKEFSLDRTRRYSLLRALVSADQRERVKRKEVRK